MVSIDHLTNTCYNLHYVPTEFICRVCNLQQHHNQIQDLQKSTENQIRPQVGILIEYDWCPQKKRTRHQDYVHTDKRLCENTTRGNHQQDKEGDLVMIHPVNILTSGCQPLELQENDIFIIIIFKPHLLCLSG